MSIPEGMVELPLERQRMRGFHIFTKEGSCFVARFDPRYEDPDVDEVYGLLVVIGRPRTSNEELRLEGIGFVPRPGGAIKVSDQPEREYELHGEVIKEFPQETIDRVTEFQIPKTA
jgi:hypothetical protein